MSLWDNVKKFAQPYSDDDYDDYDEGYDDRDYDNGYVYDEPYDHYDEFGGYDDFSPGWDDGPPPRDMDATRPWRQGVDDWESLAGAGRKDSEERGSRR